MTAEAKIAQGRMTLLQLAERLRNVSEACRRRGVSRSQFYEYKRVFQEQGLQGLVGLPGPKACLYCPSVLGCRKWPLSFRADGQILCSNKNANCVPLMVIGIDFAETMIKQALQAVARPVYRIGTSWLLSRGSLLRVRVVGPYSSRNLTTSPLGMGRVLPEFKSLTLPASIYASSG